MASDPYPALRRRLMERLHLSGEADDAEVRHIITELVTEAHREGYLSLEERSRLSRELFASVRRLDILEELLEDAPKSYRRYNNS